MPEADSESFAVQLRKLRGNMTLRELGSRANYSKSFISDLEHGRRSPTLPVARGLDRALGAGGELVSSAETQRQQHLSEEAAGAPDNAVGNLLREWDEMWRRDFLKSAGAAVVANLGTDNTGASTTELMRAHNELRAAHGRLDNLRGASSVYAPAVDHHHQVLTWLSTARTTAEQKQIAALAADTGGFVGFLTYDLGMAENAAAYYRDAAGHARQAGDLSSCTNLLGQMSRILADQGHYRRALDLADGALHLSGTKTHPAVRSWLHAVRAHHHACLTNARAAQADLKNSWTLLERAHDGETPPYIGYLSAPELGKWTGHAMVRLGRTDPSFLTTGKTALDEARATWPATIVRGSAEMLTASAHIYAARGDRDEATDLASRSVAIATATGSARNLRAALAAQTLVAAQGT